MDMVAGEMGRLRQHAALWSVAGSEHALGESFGLGELLRVLIAAIQRPAIPDHRRCRQLGAGCT